jgi:cytochrome d ubiquinol oxidase subunit I
MVIGDSTARAIYNDQPIKFAAIELNTTTGPDKPEILLGRLNEEGEVEGGLKIPGLASWLSDPSTGTSTVVQGLDSVPADDRPSRAAVNTIHLAWDIMVGMGTALVLLALWFAVLYWRRRDQLATRRWFLRVAVIAPIAAYMALESGWIITEVGRQPWVVYERMRTEEAVTGAGGIPVGYAALVLVYAALAVATAWMLRRLARSPLEVRDG